MENKLKNKKNIIPLGITIGGQEITMPTFNRDLTTIGGFMWLLGDILTFAIWLSALIAVVLIIYSGFLFMTSTGEPEKIGDARKALTAAIIGFVIAFISRMIVVFIVKNFLL